MNTSLDFKMLKQPTHEKVANYIRKDILLGKWNYQDHLSEKSLAEEFNLSRGPIRDALKVLNVEGLIEIQNNGRPIVIGFNHKSFFDWSKMRIFLETLAIEEYSSNPDPLKLAELDQIVQMMELCKDLSDKKQHIWLDYKFHMSLVESSENRALIKLWRTLSGTLLTMLELIAESYDNKKQIQLHKLIVQNLQEDNIEKASAYLVDHIKEGERVIQSVVKWLNTNEDM